MQKPETRPRRKSKVPDNSFRIAEKGHRLVFVDQGGNRYHRASEAYHRILELLFPAIDEKEFSFHATVKLHTIVPSISEHYPCGIFATMHVAPKSHQEAATKLFLEIQEAIQTAYQAGAERGKDLLIQLAKGNITAKQLNNLALEDEA